MMPDNNWYGHRSILARFCNIKDQPIFGTLQHGWFTAHPKILFSNRKIKLFKYFCWNSEFRRKANSIGFKNFYAIGSPFLYLCKLKGFNYDTYNNQGEGTILFPSKTTYDEKRFNTDEDLIKIAIKNYPPPYAVSLFHSDQTSDLVNLYKNYGFKILGFGKRTDSDFLDQFYDAVMKKKYVLSNEPSTAILYSMYLGKKCHINLDSSKINKLSLKPYARVKNFLNSDKLLSDYKLILKGQLSLKEQFEIAKFQLGYDDLLNQAELIKILGWSNFIKKFYSKLISKYIDIKHGNKERLGDI